LPTRNSMCTLQNQAQISTPRRRFDYDAYIKGRLEGRYVVTYIDDEVAMDEVEPMGSTDDIKAAPEDIEENLLQSLHPYDNELPQFNFDVVNSHQCGDLFRTASLSSSLCNPYAIEINCRGGPKVNA
jgi:hypothetical protein